MVTRAAFSSMSLSFTITARTREGDRSYFFAAAATPAAMSRQNSGVQAGVRQRTWALTLQMVLARHSSLRNGEAAPSDGGGPGVARGAGGTASEPAGMGTAAGTAMAPARTVRAPRSRAGTV